MSAVEALLPQWQEDRVLLNVPASLWTEDEFFAFCQANHDLRIERTANGGVILMPPAGSESGSRNADLTADLVLWNRQTRLGKVFDSSSGFTLPSGAERSPDTSWVEIKRWEALPPALRRKFAHICPDFVAELRSDSARLPELQKKMREYIANGARLGWLIDPQTKSVEVYRPHQEVQVMDDPVTLSGEDVLPEFTMDMVEIWD